MAEEKEKILYEFQGDVSSLRKTTNDAIGMLDKFQSNMDKLNSDGIVKASQRAQAGFQNSVNRMIKGVTAVQKKLKSVGDVRMPRGTEAFNATKLAADVLESTLNKLNSSNTITSKGLNAMKAELNNVTAGLKSAGPSFDSLISKEEKFQKRLETIGNVSNRFSSKVQGATQKVQGTFDTMGTFVGSKLGALGAKFEPLVTKIQGFKDKAVVAGNRVAQVFTTVASAFRRASDGTEGASASQNKFGTVLDGIREKFNKHQKELKKTSDGYKNMEGASSGASAAMAAGAAVAGKALETVKNVVGGLVDSFFALAGVEIGNLLSDGAKSAIDYVESLNLFQVAMGNSVDKGTAFVNKMQEVYGMDPNNIYRHVGYFYQLTDAIGMSEKASAAVSLSMTKAATDLASLFDKDIETVVDDLSSGMMGMSRTVRKYGMDIRTTTLQQTAFKYGLTEQVESMSEANRQALRFITMLDQAQNALHQTTDATGDASTEMGDFARNIETPANQLRIFKEQMSQLGRAIGNFIVAPIAKALPYINGFIMALRTLVNFLATLMGVSVKAGNSLSSAGKDAEDTASGIGSIGGAADKASKKLKQLIAPFDELNVLQESAADGGVGGGSLIPDDALDPTLAKALADMELNLENISMKANKVRDDILGFLGLKVTTDPITGEQIIQWDKEAFKTNVLDSLDKFKDWFNDLSPVTKGIVILTVGLSSLANPVAVFTGSLALLLTSSEDFKKSFTKLFSKVGDSLEEWGITLGDVFSTVGEDITAMWDTHIQPTIEAIGTALAPALETLGSLWENLSTIINDIFIKIGNLWSTVLKPVLEGAMEIIQDLCDIFRKLWVEYVGPVIEYIGDGVERLWDNTLSPIIDKVIVILGKLWDLIMALWNNVFKPIIDWLAAIWGPAIESTFSHLWDTVEQICTDIGGKIDGLLLIFEGIIDFLTGVFTGDWGLAWSGVLKVFEGIWATIVSIVKAPVNLVIGLINGMIQAMETGLNFMIDAINTLSFDIPDWIPGIGGETFGFDLDRFDFEGIPYLATGGVVTGPTAAIIGEGKYSEAVLPLDDSPQMNDLINKIVEAIDKDDPNPQPVEVKVYIGDKEYDAYTYKASERGKKIVGKQPVKIGG